MDTKSCLTCKHDITDDNGKHFCGWQRSRGMTTKVFFKLSTVACALHEPIEESISDTTHKEA